MESIVRSADRGLRPGNPSPRASAARKWLAATVLLAAAIPAQIGTARAVPDTLPPAHQPINRVIGDASFEHAFGDRRLAAAADDDLRIRTHLSYVEHLLRDRDVSDWPAELQRARAANIERLRTYHENGVFPRNYDHRDERRPCFIDRDGRVCAVGYLVEQSAGRELAEAINARFQYELLEDMEDERLAAWASTSGLTVRELRTIQPSYGPYPARAGTYGASCAPDVTVAPYVVTDPIAHFGLYGWWGPRAPFWWVPAPADSQWIASANFVEYQATYTLTQSFDLTGLDPATASISGVWSANPNAQILLNGSPTGAALPQSGWTSPLPFTISSGFVPGINELEFRVPADSGFFGLLVSGLAGTAQRNGTAHAIPDLFNTGVDASGAPLQGGTIDPHYRSDEPPLRAIGRPVTPNPNFGFTLDTIPNRTVALAVSLGPASTPIAAGCEILLDSSTLFATLGRSDAQGMARFQFPVPPLSYWWMNISFYAQGVVEDPSSPIGGLSLTQGLQLMTGS